MLIHSVLAPVANSPTQHWWFAKAVTVPSPRTVEISGVPSIRVILPSWGKSCFDFSRFVRERFWFSYFDTQRHRLGPNFQQIPVNQPKNKVYNYNSDSYLSTRNQYFPNADVNYQPSSYVSVQEDTLYRASKKVLTNEVIAQSEISKKNYLNLIVHSLLSLSFYLRLEPHILHHNPE